MKILFSYVQLCEKQLTGTEASRADNPQAEIERVEKAVAKMQKKNALLADGDDEPNAEALEDADETPKEDGGAKEPTHSQSFMR